MRILKKGLLVFVAFTAVWQLSSAGAGGAEQDSTSAPRVSFTINESAINAFLGQLGPVTQHKPLVLLGRQMDITWTITNPHVTLLAGRGVFDADVQVQMGTVSYPTKARGNVVVRYDKQKNDILVSISDVTFSLYTTVLNKRMNISQVNISRFYQPSVAFDAPRPAMNAVEIAMPEGGVKKVFVDVAGPEIRFEPGMVVVASGVVFSTVPARRNG